MVVTRSAIVSSGMGSRGTRRKDTLPPEEAIRKSMNNAAQERGDFQEGTGNELPTRIRLRASFKLMARRKDSFRTSR